MIRLPELKFSKHSMDLLKINHELKNILHRKQVTNFVSQFAKISQCRISQKTYSRIKIDPSCRFTMNMRHIFVI